MNELEVKFILFSLLLLEPRKHMQVWILILYTNTIHRMCVHSVFINLYYIETNFLSYTSTEIRYKPHLHALKQHGTAHNWQHAAHFRARHSKFSSFKRNGSKWNVAPVPKIVGVQSLPLGGTGNRCAVQRFTFV